MNMTQAFLKTITKMAGGGAHMKMMCHLHLRAAFEVPYHFLSCQRPEYMYKGLCCQFVLSTRARWATRDGLKKRKRMTSEDAHIILSGADVQLRVCACVC